MGGSASVTEMEEHVARILNLSEDEINFVHRGSITKFSYRLAWTRNYLKRYGLLESSARGVWALTVEGRNVQAVNKEEVKRALRKAKRNKKERESQSDDFYEEVESLSWHEELIEIMQNMPPDRFERLCQRLLRELGFINVEVTGKTGDGGIDGRGVIRLGGVLSFHVSFQSKRYKGTVSPSIVRDFRGAMIGRADKGLIITTGVFSNEAKKEAQRDGAPPIDLIDGTQLTTKLKELHMGVEVEEVISEKVKIKTEWFQTL